MASRELLGLVTLKRLGSSLGGTFAAAIDETDQKQSQMDECSAEFTTLNANFQKWLGDVEQKFEAMPPAT